MGKALNNRLAERAGTTSTSAIEPEDSMESHMMGMESRFQQAMPRGAEAANLVRDAINVLRQNPKLANCDPNSVKGALMTCAQLGLRPGIGALGQAHLVPFWNKNLVVSDGKGGTRKGGFSAQFIIGYQGMLELANRSGEIDLVVARIVYTNDEFQIDFGNDSLIHRPAMDGRGEVRGYYAKFYRKGSDRATYEWLSVKDAQEHRDRFATAKDKNGKVFGPWVDHFDGMALKTCVRMLFKWMPKSTQMNNAIAADESLRIDYDLDADIARSSETVRPEITANIETGEVDATEDGGPTPEEMEEIYAQEREGR